ncbi:MAG: hypothetical protein RMY16_06780 [Nostoc sp. DedQUE12b]|uniref:hypothetical protein n=1 Tax=Nostoc sp. DedQUE12b TaxID=3075398 RepID=UPI002AD1E960|nr:hypothetical protein [Nostoc sp. DedQUE12b]MDZ8085287.1 hypothetical protein [Nostoc sp. DedQUE12b]
MKGFRKLSSIAVLLFAFMSPPSLAEAKDISLSNALNEQSVAPDTNLVGNKTGEVLIAQRRSRRYYRRGQGFGRYQRIRRGQGFGRYQRIRRGQGFGRYQRIRRGQPFGRYQRIRRGQGFGQRQIILRQQGFGRRQIIERREPFGRYQIIRRRYYRY